MPGVPSATDKIEKPVRDRNCPRTTFWKFDVSSIFTRFVQQAGGGGWGWGGVVRGGGWGGKRRRGLVVTMYRPISANFICRSLACLFTNWDLLSRKGWCCCNGVDCCCNVGNSLLYSVSKKSILSTYSAINVH